MKIRLAILVALGFAVSVGTARGEKPLKDYSFIRGVNYGMDGDQATIERDLGYARRINLNSTRIWLSYKAYEADPQGFISRLRNYIRVSQQMGITTVPILFNGNGLNPDTLKPAFHTEGDAYVKAIVDAVKDEPGLLMWDIMNEPLWNDYYNNATGDTKQQHRAEIGAFVRYYLNYVKQLDSVNAVTVGYALPGEMEDSADLVDVLSFHNYTPTRASVEDVYSTAEEIAKKYGKPLLNTETACISRANPYDEVLQIAEEHKTGWYLFNLMIGGYWGEVHGIFYPDGTVRDPSIVAAIMGFYRNRDLNTIVRALPNREGHAVKALQEIEDALNQDKGTLGHPPTEASMDRILDAAEHAANLLEAAQLVPMNVPPSAQIMAWRQQPPEKLDREAIRKFAYELGLELKKDCQLYESADGHEARSLGVGIAEREAHPLIAKMMEVYPFPMSLHPESSAGAEPR